MWLRTSSSVPMTTSSRIQQSTSLRRHYHPCHDGVSIGVVCLNPKDVQTFRNLLEHALGENIRFRRVECDDDGRRRMIHLPPAAAALLDDGHADLMDFLKTTNGEYRAGVRRKRKSHNPIAASIQTAKKNLPPVDDVDQDGGSFTFVELFAGIGGFRLGLEDPAVGGRCILSSEINAHAASIYRNNFDTDSSSSCRMLEGDILDLDYNFDLDFDFDMLTAGFPCQPFTNRGTQQGLDDYRGQMYRELTRVLHHKQPPCFLFENVVGLVTMDGGSRSKRTRGKLTCFDTGAVFEQILEAFRSCGYKVDWNVVNSRHFLPQQRERVYIVGTRLDLGYRSFDWECMENNGANHLITTVRSILEPKDCPSVVASELTPHQWKKVQDMHLKRNTLAAIDGRIDIDGKAPTLISLYHQISSFSTKYLFEQADGTRCDGVGENRRPRFLTPRECCRIMGFPESFKVPCPTDTDSVAHFYRAIGNAVTPPVISVLGKELMRCVREKNTEAFVIDSNETCNEEPP